MNPFTQVILATAFFMSLGALIGFIFFGGDPKTTTVSIFHILSTCSVIWINSKFMIKED